jgi:hypothetical protein
VDWSRLACVHLPARTRTWVDADSACFQIRPGPILRSRPAGRLFGSDWLVMKGMFRSIIADTARTGTLNPASSVEFSRHFRPVIKRAT